jgi:riboflavin synthase
MFTGIVQEVGTVKQVTRRGNLYQIAVASDKLYDVTAVSESVCTSGVCLTVTKKDGGLLYFDVMKQTLDTTTLKDLTLGDCVNLEGALALGGKLDGHFVLGHVDSVVRIRALAKRADDITLTCELPAVFKAYVVAKGSVALDGISLTIAACTPTTFTVKLIPYTWKHTALKSKRTGSLLNVEFDYLAKLVNNRVK